MEYTRLTRNRGISFGRVTIESRRVAVEVITERFVAGESFIALAHDYRCSPQDILAAIRLTLAVKGTSLASKRAQARVTRIIPEEV